MATLESLDTRITVLETEFRTELRHLAAKEDIADLRGEFRGEIKALEARLMLRLGGLIVGSMGVLLAVLRLWP